ncbi:c29469d9-87bb-4b5a-abe0-094e55834c89 [Sclerotinia trifoliorum]|uniref:C29469d9-87bb-4b5a-abe0-094e55834c89 n=1 Tax=Sclerotinia trifoliorum TaxID=28548 RepID=A0A8H2VKW2_9HELO|nr:c29469d9-87bb-4b5a-abe0-094e55834c89 [Sclerotinia trifoliorum]
MLFHSFFALFSLFLCALATVPATVYRGDSRSPADLKKVNGFQTYAATNNVNPNLDLIVHCQGGHDDDDGYVSTSKSYKVASNFGRKKDGYVYYIDTSHSPSQYIDVAAWCKANSEKNPIPKEQEFSSKAGIPWSSIVKWDKIEKGKVVSSETRIAFDAGGTNSRPSSSGKGSTKGSRAIQIRGATREKITDLEYQ